MGTLALAVLLTVTVTPAVPTGASAAELRFALTVDLELLRGALRRHLHAQPGGQLELWRTADGCGTFQMRDASVDLRGGRLRIAGPASASAGLPLFGLCWASVGWTGLAEIVARPEIGSDWRLRLRDPEMELAEAAGQRRGVATRIFAVTKGWVEAELATFAFDVGPPAQEVRGLLDAFAGPAGGPLATALQTLRPVGLAVEPDAVRVILAFDLAPIPPAPRSPEPALTPAEVRRWEAALERWDGFLAFVVKDLGGANAEPAVRDELLELLLEARRNVLTVLGRGPEPGTDPVRGLFLSVWERLRSIVRRTTATQEGDASRAFRYVVFLAAGDALAVIEKAAPAVGIELSADGLRRLARALDPAYGGDPLEYSEQPDPELRRLFRFRDPDAPPRRPRRKPAGSWRWLAPRAAEADEIEEWRRLGARLDRWVADPAELSVYRSSVDRLLVLAAERAIDPDLLDERFDDLFHYLVKTVAWQESCWRQFVRQAGRVTYVASSTGDVGMMQINVRVWRGFFNPEKLRWSATYNAGAGAEILQHHLIRYGVREARVRLDDAARATYSAYHGGPARYRRYRTAGVAPAFQAVDRAFWDKYRLVASGQAGDRVLCLAPARLPS